MFFQLLYIHLFRPFLKYNQQNSPLPPNVSPRRLCTQAAAMISKLMRLYKRSHGLRQICNIAVYILHTACTIHLLNLPDKNAKRDITHGIKHLEEMAEGWLCARRTLAILSVLSKKWRVELPSDALEVLSRTDAKYGAWGVENSRASSQKAESMSPRESPMNTSLQPSVTFYNPLLRSPQGAVMPPRRPSANQVLPPQSAADFGRNQLYHAPQTPQPNVTGPPVSRPGLDSNPSPAGSSPSALFGGVDQLIRDSSDWWLRDQSQLAVGFEQWPMAEGEWLGAATSPIAPVHPNIAVNGMAQNGANNIGPPSVGPNGVGNGAFNGVNGMNGVNGFGAAGIRGYNENEWYS
jgi:hypothetical protein